ncbi:putative CAP superfamily protein [Helianthus annuus]|uniref:CAP superfamily protein n=1 Tax=Helianthus annuus TaxID=4232 RepID=A0A251UY79_HELAN|nr:pathogenesis-related protein 1B [Helianthus annuus]KAF5809328.1 putative CAP superfamily protein [Helianthus annuus]KAJ0580339.1 putative CAP domain-containing protein [Helianthus annuus]KAJ0587851.1 putative CAP domain-containing protein [Helianthus annuus]KAJ0596286.1 putative CAP domain-containing protein [Helianthus annuus]KAJ0756951.1 putative CAP domain-containing protein [Helianthus annuus]
MVSFKLQYALIWFLIIAIFHSTHAQNSQTDYLNAHNTARAQVGVGNMVWNTTLATFAQNYANRRIQDCNLVDSNGPYGENLAKGRGSFIGTAAVNLWVSEKQYYDRGTNTCASGRVCEHYTQVVWRNSIQLGCASVQCANGWWFIICNYSPRGNIIGQPPY